MKAEVPGVKGLPNLALQLVRHAQHLHDRGDSIHPGLSSTRPGEIPSELRPLGVSVRVLALDLAVLIEVEDIQSVPTNTLAIDQEVEPPRHQWNTPSLVARDIVVTDPADGRLARLFIYDPVIYRKVHLAKGAAELRFEGRPDTGLAPILGPVSRPIVSVVGKERHHVVEVIDVEALDEPVEGLADAGAIRRRCSGLTHGFPPFF